MTIRMSEILNRNSGSLGQKGSNAFKILRENDFQSMLLYHHYVSKVRQNTPLDMLKRLRILHPWTVFLNCFKMKATKNKEDEIVSKFNQE